METWLDCHECVIQLREIRHLGGDDVNGDQFLTAA